MPPDEYPADGWAKNGPSNTQTKQHTEMTGKHRYLPGLFPHVRFNSGPLTRRLQPPSQGGDTGSNPVGTTSENPQVSANGAVAADSLNVHSNPVYPANIPHEIVRSECAR
jgi:hypothetical protein